VSTELPPPTTTADQQQWITEHWAGPMLGQIMELIAAGELNEGECWVVGMVVGGHIKWPTIRDDGLLIAVAARRRVQRGTPNGRPHGRRGCGPRCGMAARRGSADHQADPPAGPDEPGCSSTSCQTPPLMRTWDVTPRCTLRPDRT